MSKLIIVCGLPGSGKTTLAAELSKRLKIVCIHKDSIKQTLFDSLKLKTLEDSIAIGKPSVDVLFYLAQQQIENGVDIIIESPFNFEEDYDIFRKWEEENNVTIYSVICSTSKEERFRRMDERARHHAHFDLDRKNIKHGTYAEDAEFDYATIPGKQIKIETNQPVDVLVKNVIARIA